MAFEHDGELDDERKEEQFAELKRRMQMQRNIDEGRSLMIDHLPALWRGMYMRAIAEGFTPDEAMTLVRTYIMSQCSAGVHIHRN